jgi:hypothetical protein
MIKVEVNLKNGVSHKMELEKTKEEFFDILRFNRDAFLKDTKGVYFIVSSVMSFKIEGDGNE